MKILRKSLIVLLFLTSFVLVSCKSNTTSNKTTSNTSNNTSNTTVYYLPDNLNGGGEALEGELSETSISSYIDTSYEDLTEFELSEDEENKTLIDLSNLSSGDYTGYSLSKKGKLSITTEGTYELTGALSGFISVDAIEGDIKIILNNVTVTVPETTASAAIVFKGSDTDTVGKRVLVVKSNTTNTLTDSILCLSGI